MIPFSGEGGTAARLGNAVVISGGAFALLATFLSFWSILVQLKNYRKPLLQRYVVRILIIIPIYAFAAWFSMISLTAAFFIDPFRDVYEGFVIYSFFNLLVNFLGGERSIIIMMHGRMPVAHLWPLRWCLPKIDVGDPHSFLAIKRGILQYAYLKPLLATATIAMKATNTYQEGYLGLKSGYFWSGLIYNISITVSLYSLATFWMCLSPDLKQFRPMPKFLCVKLMIFASYWQGLLLSILVWLEVIPDIERYTADNIALAIQNALICYELPLFAISHWYAFSWKDYADSTISTARLPVKYALRDAFGIKDLLEDFKDTVWGVRYEYRYFDPSEDVIAHPDSDARVARMMEGLRFKRNGKGKYWVRKPKQTSQLLGGPSRPDYTFLGTESDHHEPGESKIDFHKSDFDERLYQDARLMKHGDYNYPVTFVSRLKVTEDDEPRTSTHQAILKDTTSAMPSSTDRSGEEYPRDSRRNGIVDLLVEDVYAEERQRVRDRKEGGSGINSEETRIFHRTTSQEGGIAASHEQNERRSSNESESERANR